MATDELDPVEDPSAEPSCEESDVVTEDAPSVLSLRVPFVASLIFCLVLLTLLVIQSLRVSNSLAHYEPYGPIVQQISQASKNGDVDLRNVTVSDELLRLLHHELTLKRESAIISISILGATTIVVLGGTLLCLSAVGAINRDMEVQQNRVRGIEVFPGVGLVVVGAFAFIATVVFPMQPSSRYRGVWRGPQYTSVSADDVMASEQIEAQKQQLNEEP